MDKLRRREMIAMGALAPAFARFCNAAAEPGDEVIPFLDTKPPNPERPTLPWEQTTEWMTPKPHRFRVGHYGYPDVDVSKWQLQISGQVDRPRGFSLDDLKKRKAKEEIVTIECSGNPAAGGMIYNTKWKGTALAPILKECGIKPEGIEAVFFAADSSTEKIRGGDYQQNFARSLSIREALKDNVILCWEMNGEPLEKNFGAPVRLVAPGWYGVAWVKWLTRIEIHDRAYLARFMGRDYVTIRGEKQGDQTIWRETSVGRMNLKSVVGRVSKRKDGTLHVMGAAWSGDTPVQKVELKLDDSQWMSVPLSKGHKEPNTWAFWSYEWKGATPGEHSLVSRATDVRGKVQPAPDDPFIALKKTYWEANQQAVRKIKI